MSLTEHDQTSQEAARAARRERWARVLGVAVAVSAMACATLLIHWPAPAVSVALGFLAYLLARARRR